MKHGFIALLSGLVFGLGLTISGMTQPLKVISFLDFFGNWDPSLAFVMAGAIGVHLFAYRIKKNRTSPFFADSFSVPDNKKVDSKLIAGSALFGVGWGLAGFCPGPAITSLVSLRFEIVIFIVAMAGGMLLQDFMFKKRA